MSWNLLYVGCGSLILLARCSELDVVTTLLAHAGIAWCDEGWVDKNVAHARNVHAPVPNDTLEVIALVGVGVGHWAGFLAAGGSTPGTAPANSADLEEAEVDRTRRTKEVKRTSG